MVQVLGMTLEEALPYMTCQVAEGLDLLGIKGTVAEGADADLLLFDQDLTLDTYVARGKIFMKHGEVIRKGTYEEVKRKIKTKPDIWLYCWKPVLFRFCFGLKSRMAKCR